MNRGRREGSSLVEFALVLLILVLLLIGVVDIGRAFHSYITITNAAREGARRASRFPYPEDEPKILQAVQQEATNSHVDLSGSDAQITVGRAAGVDTGQPISVTVEYTFTTFIGGLVGLPRIPMRSSTEMVIYGYHETP